MLATGRLVHGTPHCTMDVEPSNAMKAAMEVPAGAMTMKAAVEVSAVSTASKVEPVLWLLELVHCVLIHLAVGTMVHEGSLGEGPLGDGPSRKDYLLDSAAGALLMQ